MKATETQFCAQCKEAFLKNYNCQKIDQHIPVEVLVSPSLELLKQSLYNPMVAEIQILDELWNLASKAALPPLRT